MAGWPNLCECPAWAGGREGRGMSSDDRNTGQAAGSAGAKSTAATWGEGLSYPEWMTRLLPAVHDVFTAVNKYVSVPALKMGLGRYMSNPATGYLMILRTRGRKSGEMRDAPLATRSSAAACTASPVLGGRLTGSRMSWQIPKWR